MDYIEDETGAEQLVRMLETARNCLLNARDLLYVNGETELGDKLDEAAGLAYRAQEQGAVALAQGT